MSRRRPPKLPRPAPAPHVHSRAISDLEARLGLTATRIERDALIEDFWRSTPITPLLEKSSTNQLTQTRSDLDERTLTFLWRSDTAQQVLLFVNRLTDETDLTRSQLDRLTGTDIWHLSYLLPAGWRGSYGFIEHTTSGPTPWSEHDDQVQLRALLDRALSDPRNPRSCPNRAGIEMSVAELPHAPAQTWVTAAVSSQPGAGLREAVGPDGRRCWIYGETHRPSSGNTCGTGTSRATDIAAPRTLWFVLDGEVWAQQHHLGAMLSTMEVAGASPPLCAVLIDSLSTAQRWEELGDPAAFCELLTNQYLPWARQLFDEAFETDHCGIAGQSIGGYTALWCGTQRPETFGRILSQSASLWLEMPHPEPSRAAAVTGQRYRVEVGTQEWVLLEPNRAAVRQLADAGAEVELNEFEGGHDYACWRGTLAEGIAELSSPAAH